MRSGKNNEFVSCVLDRLEGVGTVHSRAMFGGHGIYLDDVIVGLVVDGVLYLKTDDENRAAFTKAGSSPFSYDNAKTGKKVETSYWEVPAPVLDDAEELRSWARESALVATRAARPAKKNTR